MASGTIPNKVFIGFAGAMAIFTKIGGAIIDSLGVASFTRYHAMRSNQGKEVMLSSSTPNREGDHLRINGAIQPGFIHNRIWVRVISRFIARQFIPHCIIINLHRSITP